jgi:polyhydroxybutyrate depolymerase
VVLAALVAAGVALLLLLNNPADPLQRASAAMDCRPAPGNRFLDGALLHIPLHARAPLALVLAFHGAGGDGTGFAEYSGLSKTADAHDFAVLYPNAAAHEFWSLNRATHPDDVERLRALLPKAMQAACGDPLRVFATGVSNGGGFSARVGCELAGTIAAVAPVAGGYRALDPCPSGQRTSVLEIHGTSDGVVPYHGKPPDRAGAVPRFLAGWARRDDCDARPTRTRPRRGVIHLRYSGCEEGFAVEHLRLAGIEHGWPYELDTNEQIWRFFAAHPARSASVGDSRAARSAG